jgi:hypothetical protein
MLLIKPFAFRIVKDLIYSYYEKLKILICA